MSMCSKHPEVVLEVSLMYTGPLSSWFRSRSSISIMMVTLWESLNLILHSKGGLSRVLGSLGQAGPGYNSQTPSDVRRCDRLPLRRSLIVNGWTLQDDSISHSTCIAHDNPGPAESLQPLWSLFIKVPLCLLKLMAS